MRATDSQRITNEALGIRPRNATSNRLIVDSVDHGILNSIGAALQSESNLFLTWPMLALDLDCARNDLQKLSKQ